MEEQMEYYYRLGRILYKHYNGELLSHGELVAVVSASKDDYMLALELNAMERLKNKKDDGVDNLLKNSLRMKQIKSIKGLDEKTR